MLMSNVYGHEPINDGALPFGGWADGGGAFRNWLVSVQISWGPASAPWRVDILSRDLDLPRWRHLIGGMVPDVGWHLDVLPLAPPPPLVNPNVVVRLSTLVSYSGFSRSLSARILFSCLLRSICCNTLFCFSATAIRHGMDIFAAVCMPFFGGIPCLLCIYISGQRL